MKIVAVTTEGREFMYKSRTAHKVSERSAARIAETLNKIGFEIDKASGEKWSVFTVDNYSSAIIFAETQKFSVYKGNLVRTYSQI